MEVSFYSRTPCQTANSYPEDIQDILLAVFDKEGILVVHQEAENIQLSAEYIRQIEIGTGLYTVIAWSGLDEDLFDRYELQDSITTREDLLFRIKRAAGEAVSIEGNRLFFGESTAVYIPESNSPDPLWAPVSINMQEITNRILVTVEGLNRPDDFGIIIESGSTAMNIEGTIAQDEVLQFPAIETGEEGVVEARFTLLKLETGVTNTITLRHTDSGLNLFRGSLLGALLLMNPDINLACDHDFTVTFVVDDECQCGTYAITEIWINGWLVHSYETEM